MRSWQSPIANLLHAQVEDEESSDGATTPFSCHRDPILLALFVPHSQQSVALPLEAGHAQLRLQLAELIPNHPLFLSRVHVVVAQPVDGPGVPSHDFSMRRRNTVDGSVRNGRIRCSPCVSASCQMLHVSGYEIVFQLCITQTMGVGAQTGNMYI